MVHARRVLQCVVYISAEADHPIPGSFKISIVVAPSRISFFSSEKSQCLSPSEFIYHSTQRCMNETLQIKRLVPLTRFP